MRVERILTILVIVLGVLLFASLVYLNFETQNEQYDSSLKYSVSKLPTSYDYSCDEPVYGLYVTVSNIGAKSVSGFTVTLSNPLCKGAIPSLPQLLLPFQQINFYAYSGTQNGTLTISGNNTLLQISF